MPELTTTELTLIIEALDDSIDTLRSALKDLTDLDERYERMDTQIKLQETIQLYDKMKEARDAKNRTKSNPQ